MNLSRASCLLPLVLVFTSSLAFAQSAAPPLHQTLSGDAKTAYESGLILYKDGDATGALTKFAFAYDASGDARLLWNMAVCEKTLRHYAATATYIERYLKEGTQLTPEQRSDAIATLAALREYYSRVTLVGIPVHATITVDGELVVNPSDPLLLDLGGRKLRIAAPGFEPHALVVDVKGKMDQELRVELKRAEEQRPTPPAALPGRLTILARGERDTITVDGKVVGSQRWEGSVTPGQHTVRVTAPDKKPYYKQIDLKPGATQTLDVTLENDSSDVWYWVGGGAAALAVGVVGGYFLLKPEDSGGGHPSGSLTTVFLP